MKKIFYYLNLNIDILSHLARFNINWDSNISDRNEASNQIHNKQNIDFLILMLRFKIKKIWKIKSKLKKHKMSVRSKKLFYYLF